MKFVFACLALITLTSAAGKAQKENPKEKPMILWTSSLSEALQLAKEQNRPVFVAINMEGFQEQASEQANDDMVSQVYRDKALLDTSKQSINVIASAASHEYQLIDDGKGGKKRLCNRFKQLSCEEHQRVEAAIRREYFKNVQDIVAPQHLTLRPDGTLIERKEYQASAKELEKMIQSAVQIVGKPNMLKAPEAQKNGVAGKTVSKLGSSSKKEKS